MAMSDCVNCWDTPCTCGWDYLRWTTKARQDFIKKLQDVEEFMAQCPNGSPISVDDFNKFMYEISKLHETKGKQSQ